jgi:hypothetical protein
MPADTTIKLRRGTASAWTTANPTLAAGEPGFETDTGKLKVGDGATSWTGLAYLTASGGGGTPPSEGALTDASTIASDWSANTVKYVTLGGNRTLGTPTGATAGQRMAYRIVQDSTGGRTLTLGADWRANAVIAPGGVLGLKPNGGAVDCLDAVYNAVDGKFDIVNLVNVAATVASLVPTMTGYTSPSGTAFASAENTVIDAAWGGNAWKAFDSSTTSTGWLTGPSSLPQFVGYIFGSGAAHTVASYKIVGNRGDATNSPTAWTLQGSNDTTNGSDGTWTTVDTQSGQTSWSTSGTPNAYVVASPGSYTAYRLNVTTGNGNAYIGVVNLDVVGW